MTFRITTVAELDHTLIKIDGRLTGQGSDELVRTMRECKLPAALDLSELQWADEAAALLLRGLMSSGVRLQAASPYVQLLLRGTVT